MLFRVAVLGMLLFCLPLGIRQGHAAASCAKVATAAAAVATKLQSMGYTVQCGYVSYNVTSSGQCSNTQGGRNPDGCYGVYLIPPRSGGTPSGFYQLDDDEAIVTVGTMPPTANYYGYNSIVVSRYDPTSGTSITLDAPFGPAMNQRNANPGSHAKEGGAVYQLFGQTSLIVSTANTVTQADVMTALEYAYGVTSAQNAVYVEELPVDLINLGSSGNADTLRTSMRLTPIETSPGVYNSAALTYMQAPPVQILRVSPTVPRTGVASATYTSANDPLPPTKITAGQVYEQTLFAKLGVNNPQQSLTAIVNNVIANRASIGETLQSQFTVTGMAYLQGRSCLSAFQSGLAQAQANGTQLAVTSAMNCLAASPDAAYFSPATEPNIPPGAEIVAVGVNHGNLGSVTYSNLAIQQPAQYADGLLNGPLAATAAPYLGSVPASLAPYFYVLSFNTTCVAGTIGCVTVPANTPLFLIERLYLGPTTATMPDYTDIIPGTWLIFNPPSTTTTAGK